MATAALLTFAFSLTHLIGRQAQVCEPGSACEALQGGRRTIRALLWVSLASFLVALFLSYLLVPLLALFGVL